ncbi:hypothetical protein ACOSQ2_010647 [Xanthoceras sorbifolium]
MMERLGFEEAWIDKVMCCLKSASYSFLINGEVRGKVILSRGLRQGCPLSPYLFLLCAEGLSAMIHQAELGGFLHGIKIAREAPPISHLLFADDSLMFIKVSVEECLLLKNILHRYELASGQAINFEKSALSFSTNTPVDTRESIKRIFNIEVVSCHEMYLGLPSSISKNRRKVFGSIRDRVWQKLQGWKHKLFSCSGREVLVKSVAQAILTYAMSCFRLPSSLLTKLQGLFANFWWGFNGNKKKAHWLSWEKMCQPKACGGMGFRAVEAFNQAMLAKQGWRILSYPNSLMATILKARYFPKSSFLHCELGARPSFLWRSLLWEREALKLGIRWRIGNGDGVAVYNDNWIPRDSSFKVLSPKSLHARISVSALLEKPGKWNEALVRRHFWREEADLILSIPLSVFSVQDSILWHFDKRGEFSVKSAYRLALSLKSKDIAACSSGPASFWKAIWAMNLPNKVKCFAWKACKGILPTRALLFPRGIISSPDCVLCGDAVESTDHVLWSCVVTAQLWKDCPKFHLLSKIKGGDFVDRFLWILNANGREFSEHFLTAAWLVWGFRNAITHGRKPPPLENLWDKSGSFLDDFLGASQRDHLESKLVSAKDLASSSSWIFQTQCRCSF